MLRALVQAQRCARGVRPRGRHHRAVPDALLEPVTGYELAFNRQVDSAETEIFPTYFSGNATTPDQSFNCAGDFPGIGITCTGTYKGGFNTIRGLVTLDMTDKEVKKNTPFCKLKIGAHGVDVHEHHLA